VQAGEVESWLASDAEMTQKSRRKAWFRELHQTPPGVDWKAIEEANGLAQIDKRNRIARMGLPTVSNWVERGSHDQAGRMHVAVFSSDGQTLYGGSSKGGVWKGTPTGDGWTPIGDNLFGGAHWLAAVSGANTGDPDVVLAATDGGRVHVSSDDGATWSVPTGLSGLSQVRRVLTTSDGTETVFVMGRSGSQSRLFRSTDRMATFSSVRDVPSYQADVWTPRTGSSDLYLLTGTAILESTDLGDSWSSVGTPPSGSSGGELTGSEAGAPRLWAVLDRNGNQELHRSDDAGENWTFVKNLSDYWGSLNASITDATVFAYGGVEVWRTTDSGASFDKVNSWGAYYGDPVNNLHADIPGIDVWPVGPAGETWFVSTDGGLFRSIDLLGTVENLSLDGLRVSQYYSTLTSSADPRHVMAGSQDQGFQRARSHPPTTGTTLSFDQLLSGDYGHLTSGDGTHSHVFSTYPGFILASLGENSPSLHQISFPAGESNAWLPPVTASMSNRNNFYFCATRIWRYKKDTATTSWTPNLWSGKNFEATPGEYVSAFEFSTVDTQRAYAATNRGRLFSSDNRGINWTKSASTGPNAHYFYGTALLPSSLDADLVYVAGNGYSGPGVFRSTDGGATFQAWDAGLPNTLVYCLGEAPDGSGRIFCGTETAAYSREAGGTAWVDITGADAPVTTYWSVEALPHENTMRFGTYGRGIWDYQIDILARTVVYNGSDANTWCLASPSPPNLGGNWRVKVDASAHPGATITGFMVYPLPSAGTFLSGGEVLVDLASGKLLTTWQYTGGGVDTFDFPVPNDPMLVGLPSYAQGFVLGGGWELCNAAEVVIGH
jgi:photosystem II stability/assembly factor-like uncharacterized protein